MRQRACLLLLAAVIAAAQPAPQPAPSFHVGTKLVQVDVIARDRNGPAAGLTKADFTLFDNGKPQEISVFSVKSAQPLERPAESLPPGVVSNRVNRDGETPGAVSVVLLDQKNLLDRFQGVAIQEIAKFVTARRKKDRIAIYTLTRDGLRLVQDLTADDELLGRAAKSLKPLTTRTCDGTGAECVIGLLTEHAVDSRHALEAIAGHLANVPGQKSLTWITTGFPLVIPSLNLDFTPEMKAAARVLSDADVALYAVAARGLDPAGKGIYPDGFNTMDLLAELTGGEVFINTNAIAESMEAAVEEGDLVYTLGFYPPDAEKDGEEHKLKVQIARKGVSLRYRQSYFASKFLAAQASVDRPVLTDSETVERLLKQPLDSTQIGVSAQAAPDTTQAGSYQVRVSVDLHDVKLDRQDNSWVGEIGVGFYVENTEGFRVVTRKIVISENQLEVELERGAVIETSIALSGSKGVLRVAVQDHTTGAAGSVRLPLGGP